MRMRGGIGRGNALRHVQQKNDVNTLATICAIDRATLPRWPLLGARVEVYGVHELVANRWS
jgi:hypothetical protein